MNGVLPEPIPPSDGAIPRFSARAVWVTLAVLLAVAAYLCFLVLRPFVEPLLTGAVMAVIFYPLHAWVERHVARRSLAALLTTIVVIVAFVTPMVFIVSMVVRELRDAYQALGPDGVNSGLGRIWEGLQRPMETVAAWFGYTGDELRANIAQGLEGMLAAAARRAVSGVTAATGSVINAIISLLALYFALRDGAAFYRTALAHSPLGVARTSRLAEAAQGMIVASFYGVIAVAATQGVLLGIAAWITGLPAPALWGLAGAAASVLPLVGSALVWLPGAVVLFYQGSIGWGIFLLIWGAVVVANADNVVRPLVLMAKMPANGLVILITLLGGVQAFGLIGILYGPVILAVTMALLTLLREEIERSHDAA